MLPDGFSLEVLAEGMAATVDVAWAPDGRMFVATTARGLIHIVNPGSHAPDATIDLPGAVYGIALDADFANNGYLYAVRTESDQRSQRLVRLQVGPDNRVTGPETVLVGARTSCQSPPVEEDCMSALGDHDTGTIRTDPRDGTLWFGNGDNEDVGFFPDTVLAGTQSDLTLTGKILHVDRDGRGLPGHPFCPDVTDLDRPCTKVWAKGFRNPYRFSWLPSGDFLVGDVGWRSREEVTVLRTGAGQGGRNFGWPCYEGTLRPPGYVDEPGCKALYAQEGTAAAALAPAWEYAHVGSGFAVVAGPTYTGAGSYPAPYVGDSFVADYGQGWIKRLRLDGSGALQSVSDFVSDLHDPVDLELAPDGDLVFVELRGRVVAIRGPGGPGPAPTPTPGPAAPGGPPAAAPATRVEAEAMRGARRRGVARAVAERRASGGRAVVLRRTGALTATVDAPAAERLTVVARGRACHGAPTLVAAVDGVRVLRLRVPVGRLAPTSVPLGLAPGRHTLRIAFAGDRRTGSCDRALVVDAVTLTAAADVPGPAAARLLTRVEGEAMAGAAGRGAERLADTGASGGAEVRLTGAGRLRVAQPARGVGAAVLRASGTACRAALVLRRKGRERLRVALPSGEPQAVLAALGLRAGPARLELAPLRARHVGDCPATVVVDRLSLYR